MRPSSRRSATPLSLLKPGASCREIYRQHNAWLRSHDMPEERRLSVHGMGYDMVERPLIRDDEDMLLEEHMAIVCHRAYSIRECSCTTPTSI